MKYEGPELSTYKILIEVRSRYLFLIYIFGTGNDANSFVISHSPNERILPLTIMTHLPFFPTTLNFSSLPGEPTATSDTQPVARRGATSQAEAIYTQTTIAGL